MHITGSWLLLSLIGLCLGLSYLSLKVDMILFRLAPILGWMALAFMFFTNVFGTDIGDAWTTFIAFLFIVMAFAIMLLQMNAEIKHETKDKGGRGYSWTSWGKRPGPKKDYHDAYWARRAELRRRLGGGR